MKISTIHTAEIRGDPISAASGSGGQAFSQFFHQQSNDQERGEYQDRIKKLFDEIRQSAPSLLQKCNLQNFENYREKLADLMDELLHHTYLFQSEQIQDSYGRRKVYATVTIVNQKMKELGEDLLAENKEQLKFISRVDEIRGLLMDLFS